MALLANVMPATDLVVRPTAIGMDSFIQVRNESAPHSFLWTVDLPGSQRLALHDGAVSVMNGEGKAVAGFKAPTATDKNGAAVPTSYSVAGDKLAMSIGHRSSATAYPVVAEPAVAATGHVGQWNVFAPGHTVSPSGLGEGRLEVIQGTSDGSGGCQFAGTSFTASGTASEDRELAIAPGSCRVLSETGVPPASAIDSHQADSLGVRSDVRRATRPAEWRPAESAAHWELGGVSGFASPGGRLRKSVARGPWRRAALATAAR